MKVLRYTIVLIVIIGILIIGFKFVVPPVYSGINQEIKSSKEINYKSLIRQKWAELMMLLFLSQGRNITLWTSGTENETLHIQDDTSETWPELFTNEDFIDEMKKVEYTNILLHIGKEVIVVEIKNKSTLKKGKKNIITL